MVADIRSKTFELTPVAAGVQFAYTPQIGPQTALYHCCIPDVLFGGARGGGKTFSLLGDFLSHAQLNGKNAKGVLFRRTYDELDEVLAQSFEIYPLVGAKYYAGKRCWKFRNGAILKLRHLARDEDASKYQGHQYTWIGIDEAGNFPTPAPINKLRATLRSKAGVQCLFRMTANPGGPGHAWIKERYIDPMPPMTPYQDPVTGTLRVFIPSKLQDNRILVDNDPTYVQRLKESGPSWLVAAWLNGDWNATPEGGIIKAEWFRRYKVQPIECEIVQSWDTAYKDKEINDPSVCTTWAITRFGYFLLDVFRQRMDYPAVKKAVGSQYLKWRPTAVLIEDKASGQSLIQELKADTSIPVIGVEPEGDKVTRMNAVSSMFEAGLVHLPEIAAWLLDYELELTIFPLAPHDDQVDSTSQFLKWANSRPAAIVAHGIGQTRAGLQGFDGDAATQAQATRETGWGSIRRSSSDASAF